MVFDQFDFDPSALAFLGPDGVGCSYGEAADTVARASAAIAAAAAPARPRVITVLPDAPATALAHAALLGPATAIPANPKLTHAELDRIAEDADADMALCRAEDSAVTAWAEARGLGVLALTPRPERHFADCDIDLVRAAPGRSRPDDDFAIILQTSGSTGTPKLVPHTLAALMASARAIADTLALTVNDAVVHPLPMFHIGAVVDLFFAPLISGGRVRFAHPMSAQGVVDATIEAQATWLQGVPTLFHALVTTVDPDTLMEAGRSLRFIRSVSADLSPSLQKTVETAFGDVPVVQMYGMTETAGQICSNPLGEGMARPGAVGRPAGVDLALLDGFGNPAPPGREGEVCVRGASVMSGYLGRDPEEVFFGQWFRTGDIGAIDADGFVFLRGRIKEQINRGGEKISPIEVERALTALDEVSEAACAPFAHPTLGEDVGACIVPAGGSDVTPETLRAALGGRLAEFKIPRRIVIHEALPRLSGGKIDRRALSEMLDGDDSGASATGEGAQTPLGPKIARLWVRALGSEPPALDDDFFDAGGDSLVALTFMTDLEALVGRPMPSNLLYEAPTFRALEQAVHARQTAPETPAAPRAAGLPDDVFQAAKRGMAGWRGARRDENSLIVELRMAGSKPPLFFCSPTEAGYFELASALSPDRPVLAMRTLWMQEGATPENASHLARYYAEEISVLWPEGPVLLGGHCRGIALAREIARLLAERGRRIALLIEVDAAVEDVYPGPVAQIWSFNHPLIWSFSEPEHWLARHYAGPTKRFLFNVPHTAITRGETATQVAAVLEPEMDAAARDESFEPDLAAVAALTETLAERRRTLHAARIAIRAPRFGARDETLSIAARVTNESAATWAPTAESGLRLTAVWRRHNGKLLRLPVAGAAKLTAPVRPGDSVDLTLKAAFHNHTSPMFISVDMVDDGVGWFSETRGEPARRLVIPRWLRNARSDAPPAVAGDQV